MALAPVVRPRRSRGMLAGSLGCLVSLQRKQGKDALGQPLSTWVEYASVWGNVNMLTGKEKVAGGTTIGMGTASIRIRFRTDVTNGDRAVVRGIIFNIAQPLPNLSTQEYTDLPCTQGANLG
jgi:SPP1 family predicted phage head-tail adaptor